MEKGEEDVLGYRGDARRSHMLHRFHEFHGFAFLDESEGCAVVGCPLKFDENIPGVVLHRGRLSGVPFMQFRWHDICYSRYDLYVTCCF